MSTVHTVILILIRTMLTSGRYCGQYVASPSLASAGGTLEKIAYGVSIPGFIMTSTLWVHLAAKFVSAAISNNYNFADDFSYLYAF